MVALTQAEWDPKQNQLNLALSPINDTVTGQPTSMHIRGLTNPEAFGARSTDGAPVRTEPRGSELIVHTVVGKRALVIAPN